MADPIKFSELANAGTLQLSAIVAIVQTQNGELVSLQCSMAQIAQLVAQGVQFQELETESKRLIGAINEINESGGGGGGGGGDVTKAYLKEHYYDKEFFADISTLDMNEEPGPGVKLLEYSDKEEIMNYINETVNGLNDIIGSGVI